MVVKSPQGKVGTTLAAAGVVVTSVWAGSLIGGSLQPDPTRNSAAKSAGGSIGGLVAAIGGIAVGMNNPEWRNVGLMTAMLSVGLYTAGVGLLATAPGGPLGPASTGPQTEVVSTSGQTVNLHVGDTVYAQVPTTTGATWQWSQSVSGVVTQLPQLPGGTATAPTTTTENDGFTAAAAGMTVLTGTLQGAQGAAPQTFTLTVVVS